MTVGAPPKRVCHRASLITTTGASSGPRTSAATNVRPSAGDVPATAKKLSVTSSHQARLGWPSNVSVVARAECAARPVTLESERRSR